VVTNWYGVLAPAATPRPTIDRLNREIVKVMQQPEMMRRLIADGSEAVGSSPDEFRRHIAAERSQWARVIEQAGIHGQ
jgi:tripartite-type tricarboxylate transporter receptor subunit TctC